jgi:DNA-binding FrmR family transcriptional regulator
MILSRAVAHTKHDEKLLARVRRLRGQIEAIERGIEAGDECAKILHLIAASRGAINALMSEVLEGHVREHVVDPAKERSAARAAAAQQLIDVLRSYLT